MLRLDTNPPPTLAEAIERFVTFKVTTGRWVHGSELRGRLDLGQLEQLQPGRLVADVDEAWLLAYLQHTATAGGQKGQGLALASQRSRYFTVNEFL